MKVIDLLNKIANGEPLPNKIKLECVNSINEHNCFYEFNPVAETYVNEDNQLIQNATCFATLLNLEVEIIEDKKIRKIKVNYSPDIEEKIFYEDGDKPRHCVLGDAGTELLINKINEIIDYINGGTNGE